MEQGPHAETLMIQAIRTRQPVPEPIRNAPTLHAGLDLFYIAFMDLTPCRAINFGVVGPVTWLMVNEYCKSYDIQGEQREDMFYFIAKLDAAYMQWCLQKQEQKAEEQPTRRRRR